MALMLIKQGILSFCETPERKLSGLQVLFWRKRMYST